MKIQHGRCPIEACRSVKVTGTGIENDCCLAVSFEKKSEAQKIRAIREYFMEIGMNTIVSIYQIQKVILKETLLSRSSSPCSFQIFSDFCNALFMTK